MSVPGFPEAMVALLGHGDGASSAPDKLMTGRDPTAAGAAQSSAAVGQLAADLLTEVSWVLAYLTAGAEAHLNRMVALGIVPPLVAHLVWCSQQVSAAALTCTPKRARFALLCQHAHVQCLPLCPSWSN